MRMRYAKSLLLLMALVASLCWWAGAAEARSWDFSVAGEYDYPAATVSLSGGAHLVTLGSPDWWNQNWGHRQRISVNNGSQTAPAPVGTAVRIPLPLSPEHADLIAANQALASYDDVRVLWRNGSTWEELPRVVERYVDGAGTDLWFNIKEPAGIGPRSSSTAYYIYYGYPGAGSPPQSRAAIYAQTPANWPSTYAWNASGAVFEDNRTRVNGGAVQLAPVLQTPLVPSATENAAFFWRSDAGTGYVPPVNPTTNITPPLPTDGGWRSMTHTGPDQTALQYASVRDNANVWETRVTKAREQWDWTMVKFLAPTGNNRILTLRTDWQGWGDQDLNHPVYLYLWNFTSQAWESPGNAGGDRPKPAQGKSPGTLQINLTSAADAVKFVDASGQIWAAVGAKHGNYPPTAVTLKPVPDPGNGYTTASLSWVLPAEKDPDLNDNVTYKLYWKRPWESSWDEARSLDVSSVTSRALDVRDWGNWNWMVRASDGNKSQDSLTGSFTTWYDDGSCPFVYYWDGKEYKYVTDIQGTTIGPRVADTATYITPMLIPLAGFAPSGGKYKMRLREVLSEVTYFDQARLWLVDHPAGYEIVSSTAEFLRDFKMKQPLKLWTIRADARTPVAAVNHRGEDLLDRVKSLDNRPVTVDIQGESYFVFDFGKIEHPEYAKLVIDGWSVNPKDEYGSAVGKPRLPWLETIGADGQWHKVRHAGQPSGDLKTVVYDLANQFPTGDHRVRLNGLGLRIQTMVIDRVRLDDSAPVPLKIVEVDPTEASLYHRGAISNPRISLNSRILAKDDVATDVPSSYYYGAFTKFGEILPLVTAADDRYAIMRHGDALDVEFPADQASPAPGMARTPVFYADMWYKRGAADDKSIYPLPFHGMTSYPYTEAEHYPTDKLHQDYLDEWNTRVYEEPAETTPAPAKEVAAPAAAPVSGSGPATAPGNSLNTDYLAVSYGQFVSPGVYYTQPLVLTNPGEQLAAVTIDYTAAPPENVSIAVSADGTHYYPIGDGETRSFLPTDGNNKLQFRVTLTSGVVDVTPSLDSLTATYYVRTAFTPEPLLTTMDQPATRYAAERVAVAPFEGVPYTSLSSFTAQVAAQSTASVGFQISRDNGLNWWYRDAGTGNWTQTTDLAKTNTAADINANLGQFLAEVPVDASTDPGTGTFKWRAVLYSDDGVKQAWLTNVGAESTLVDKVFVAADATGLLASVRQSNANPVAVAKLTLHTDHGRATWSTFRPTLLGTASDLETDGVKVWRDNGNQSFGGQGEEGLPIGKGTFDATGKVTITLSPAQKLTATDAVYFVTFDLKSTATPGTAVQLSLNPSSFGLTTEPVLNPDEVSTTDELGNAFAYTHLLAILDAPDKVTAVLDDVTGVPSPASVVPGEPGVQVGTLNLAAETDQAALTDLTVRIDGALTDLTKVQIWRSRRNGGVRTSSDTLVGEALAPFTQDTLSFHFDPAETIGSGASGTPNRQYFLVADVAPGTAGHAFRLEIPAGGIQITGPDDYLDPAVLFPLRTQQLSIVAAGSTMSVSGQNTSAGQTAVQGATRVPFGYLDVKAEGGSFSWSGVRLDRRPGSAFLQVQVWRDDGTTPLVFDAADTLIGTTGAGVSYVTFTSAETVTNILTRYWVTADLATAGNAGLGVELGIDAGNSTYFGASGVSISGTFPIDFGPVTVTDVGDTVTQSYTSVATTAPQGAVEVTGAKLALSTPDAAGIAGLTLSLAGTAQATDLAGFDLYEDRDLDGKYSTGDIWLATGQLDWAALPAPTVHFPLVPVKGVGAAGITLLVTVDVAANAVPGRILELRATTDSLELDGTVDTVAAIAPFSTQLELTKQPTTVGVTRLSLAPTGTQGETNVSVAKVSLATNENTASLADLTVTLHGTGAYSDITRVRLWQAGAEGAFSTEPASLLAEGTLDAGRTATLTLGSPLLLTTTPTMLYVSYDFTATAAAGATYGASLAGAGAVSLVPPASGTPDAVSPAGFPMVWPALTLGRGAKTVAVQAATIAPSVALPGLINVPMLAFRPTVATDDTIMRSVTVTLSGGGPTSDVARVKIWRDGASSRNGVFSPSADQLLAGAAPVGGEAVITLPEQTITSAAPDWFYVTFDLSDTAGAGGVHSARLAGADAFSFTRGDLARTADFPFTSGLFTLQGMDTGIPALPAMTFTIDRNMDNNAGLSGVQTTLYGSAGAQVNVSVTNNGVTQEFTATPAAGSWSLEIGWRPGANLVTVTDGVTTTTFEVDLIDPFGVVYNAATGTPVANATVTVYRADDSIFGEQTTGADGQYSFLVPVGDYRMEVSAPGYDPVPPGATLITVPAGNGLGTTLGSVDGVYRDIYYGAGFSVVAAPLHFDIPLDPTGFANLALAKTVDRPTASVGDVVTYRIRLTNPGADLGQVNVVDALPAGLRYVAGSTVSGAQGAADPAVAGNTLTFTLPAAAAGSETWVSYRVVVTPAASPGEYVNTAVVQRPGSAAHFSNVATATLKVVRDAFFQTSTILGRVFLDENGNGFADPGEPGLAGAKVAADDGTLVTTDAAGRFHLAGLSGLSKGLKLDPASLAAGVRVTTANPVVVTLRPGLPVEVDFGVAPAAPGAEDGAAQAKHDFHLLAAEARLTKQGFEGRLAGQIRRQLSTGIELVASLDTDRDRESRAADGADQGYATYGDQSSSDLTATRSSSPLYLSVTGPNFDARWGDFQLPVAQGDGREVTGAEVTLRGGETTSGQPDRSLSLYAASIAYPKVRNELRALDGSLYHLSHRPVVADTERVWVEVRDEVTGRVLAHLDLSRGRDYELDYLGGRIITREPLPSIVRNGSLLGRPVEPDHPVYLVADFQYDSGDTFGPGIAGGRGELRLGAETRGSLTATFSEGGEALAGEVSGKLGSEVSYRFEAGSGNVAAVPSYTSTDGGVTFANVPAPEGNGGKLALEAKADLGQLAAGLVAGAEVAGEATSAGTAPEGKAAKGPVSPASKLLAGKPSTLQAKVAQDMLAAYGPDQFALSLTGSPVKPELSLLGTSDLAKEFATDEAPLALPGWWKQPEGIVLEGSAVSTSEGFTTGAAPATADEQQLAVKVTAKPAPGTTVSVGTDNKFTEVQSDQKTAATVRVEQGNAALSAEVGDLRTTQAGAETRERTVAAKYEYRVNEQLKLSAGRKFSYDESDLNLTTVGASLARGPVTLETEYATGERQQTGLATLAYALPAQARLYTSWEGGERDGVSQNRFTVGGSSEVSEKTRLFVERRMDLSAEGVAAAQTAGAEYKPNEKLGYSFTLGHGQAVNGAARTSGSLAMNYRAERRQASTAVEVADQSDGRQDLSLKGKAEWSLTPEVTLAGRALVSQLSGAGYTGGNVTEVAVGTAYRPVDGGRLNLLSQVILRSEDGDASGTGGDGSAVNSLVLSTEGLYRIQPAWRLGGKTAWKRAVAGDDAVDTVLVAGRALYQVAPGLELAGEYRVVKQGAETDSGPVVEAEVALPYLSGVSLGVGYNYAGFSDSLLDEEPENGWFVRLRGLF